MTTWMLAAHPEWVVLDLALIHFPAAQPGPRPMHRAQRLVPAPSTRGARALAPSMP